MTLRLPNPLSVAAWAAFLALPALAGGRGDAVFALALAVAGLLTVAAMPSPWERREPSAASLKAALLLTGAAVLSAVYAEAFQGADLGGRRLLELLRYPLLGVFAFHLIRHHDDGVRTATDWAAASAAYLALLRPETDPRGYVALLTAVWMAFFSRNRFRWLHATAAALVVLLSADLAAAEGLLLAAATAYGVRLRSHLLRRGARRPDVSAWSAVLVLTAASWWSARKMLGPALPETGQAVDLLRRSPVFGWGPGAVAARLARGQFMTWGLRGGLLEAGLASAGLLAVLRRLVRAEEAPERRAGAAAFAACAAVMLASGPFLESARLVVVTSLFAAGMFPEEAA